MAAVRREAQERVESELAAFRRQCEAEKAAALKAAADAARATREAEVGVAVRQAQQKAEEELEALRQTQTPAARDEEVSRAVARAAGVCV